MRVQLILFNNTSIHLNPLSAITDVFSGTRFKKLLFSTINTSVHLPLKPSDIKLINPSGVEDIRYFNVLHFFLSDHVSACLIGSDGFSTSISKQSTKDWTDE